MHKVLFNIGAPLIFMAVLLWALVYGWGLQDKHDCLQWQQDASVRIGYTITKSQKDQCDYWHVQIAAPVI